MLKNDFEKTKGPISNLKKYWIACFLRKNSINTNKPDNIFCLVILRFLAGTTNSIYLRVNTPTCPNSHIYLAILRCVTPLSTDSSLIFFPFSPNSTKFSAIYIPRLVSVHESSLRIDDYFLCYFYLLGFC